MITGMPTLLLLSIFILFMCGLIVSTWGRNLPARGIWLIWAGIFVLLVGVGFDSGLFLKEELVTKTSMSGWIWSKTELGAITVGLFQDPLGLAMATLAALVAGSLLLNQAGLFKEPNPERVLAALGISTAGVALAWNSLTPWIAFVGLTLTIVGGFISVGSRWDIDSEAKIAVRYIFERSFGLLLSFFGACVLATSRTALLLNRPEVWMNQSVHLKSTWVGSILLVLGLFIQMQPFPFLGRLVSKSEVYTPLRILIGQVFPVWAAFPLLIRLEPHFQSLGLYPIFGWVALFSSILSVFMGLFQSDWRLSLGVWLSAGFSLTIVLLAFSGPLAAMGMLLGVSLSAVSLAASASAFDEGVSDRGINAKKTIWLRVAIFLGSASGTGFIGFVSGTGGVRWIVQSINLPGMTALFLFIFFLFVLLGWRIAWSITSRKVVSDASWVTIFSSYILIFLSLGAVWTGTATGNVIEGSPDQFMRSLFDQFFGQNSAEFMNGGNFVSASSLYWGVLIMAIVAAYWTSGRKEDLWSKFASFIPKTSRFISQGYGIDFVTRKAMRGVEWTGRFTENLVDEKIWMEGIPKGLFIGVQFVSKVVSGFDLIVTDSIGNFLKKLVEIPAKILQLIQTGDLRWYLFFSLGSGFALLSHFLKK